MRLIIKILVCIELVVFLGICGAYLTKRLVIAHVSHAPVSRPQPVPVDKTVLAQAKSWTVLISNEGFEQKGRGTGMLIDSRHVLTANHMVPTNGNEMWIYIAPGRVVVRGKAIAQDAENDLALLVLDQEIKLPAYATFQEQHYSGEPIVIIGNILGGMRWYVSYGIISGDLGEDILMDGTMTHGDSGGPWINLQGQVVGLSDWGLETEDGREEVVKGGVSARRINIFLKAKRHRNVLSEAYNVEKSDHTGRKFL